jgi:hypothetical protein
MALMARLRRIEAGIEWLETEGMFRVCKTQVKFLKMQEQIEARLARDPGDEGARRVAPYLGIKLPPLPQPRTPTPMVYPLPAPPAPPPASAHPHPEEPGAARRLEGCEPASRPSPTKARGVPRADRDAAYEAAPQGEVLVKVPTSPQTHDIPEHMQIRPVQWRRRDASDDDDWEDGGRDYSQCLTEYDVLAEHDED